MLEYAMYIKSYKTNKNKQLELIKYFVVGTGIFCAFVSYSYAEDIEKAVEKEDSEVLEEKYPPTYMECFKQVQEKLSSEQDKIDEKIKQRNLPVEVERKKFDISKYNPKIKPKSSDVKTSLEIDLPNYKHKKEGAEKAPSCKTLYGL